MKDSKKEIIGLKIFLGSFVTELINLYGKPTLKAMIYRIGQKPGEIIAKQILKKHNKTEDSPFEIPTAAFNLFEKSISQLFEEEYEEYTTTEDDKYTIKIKNVCPMRQVIMSREDLEFGGTLCQFTEGYFESALKILTGMNVEYSFDEKETVDEYCAIKIIFKKRAQEITNSEEEDTENTSKTMESV